MAGIGNLAKKLAAIQVDLTPPAERKLIPFATIMGKLFPAGLPETDPTLGHVALELEDYAKLKPVNAPERLHVEPAEPKDIGDAEHPPDLSILPWQVANR